LELYVRWCQEVRQVKASTAAANGPSRVPGNTATRRLRRLAAAAGIRLQRMRLHMLRHTFVTTMLDAGVDLHDVQIGGRHADPRTTMRYDRARKEPRPAPNYILAAYMASMT
jgi:integrase/recombinase XerD